MSLEPGSPLLIGILVDVSKSMSLKIASNNRTATVTRLDAFREALKRIVADAASSVRKVTDSEARPDVKLFIYGFGLDGLLSLATLRLLVGRGEPKVRDLLAPKGRGEKTVDLLELADNWTIYQDNVESLASDMFGTTPMREAIEHAKARIKNETAISPRGVILFIISDGLPTDCGPDDHGQSIIRAVDEIRMEGTVVVSCIVTDADITTPRRLYGSSQASWPEEARLMFDIASTLPPRSFFEAHFKEYGWHIDPGPKLFAEVNHSEMLEEFMKVISSSINDEANRRGEPASKSSSDVERLIMKNEDRLRLVDMLAMQALNERGYFRRLVQQADLTKAFKLQRQNNWSGQPKTDALDLVDWALDKGRNPADPRYTTLASILIPELENLGFDEAAVVVASISAYKLILDPGLIARLQQKFLVPAQPPLVAAPDRAGSLLGPEIDWQGPQDAIELQSWLQPGGGDFLDVGFLRDAIRNARAVCLVSVGATGVSGTGVLIGRRLVLTNYHVLVPQGAAIDPKTNAASVRLRFGAFNGSGEVVEVGLNPEDPVPVFSGVDDLDFVLLRVGVELDAAPMARMANLGRDAPSPKSSLSILQHPYGGSMQLAPSTDAVTFTDPGRGIIQYVTRTASGSSGAPCFDSKWRLVAIHHSERSRSFGTIREGILIDPIMKRVEACLTPEDLGLE